MSLVRFAVLVGVIFLSGIVLFLGAVVTISALSHGAITYSYGAGAEAVQKTVTLAADPGAFWRSLALLGLLPMALGVFGIWWGRRVLRAG